MKCNFEFIVTHNTGTLCLYTYIRRIYKEFIPQIITICASMHNAHYTWNFIDVTRDDKWKINTLKLKGKRILHFNENIVVRYSRMLLPVKIYNPSYNNFRSTYKEEMVHGDARLP